MELEIFLWHLGWPLATPKGPLPRRRFTPPLQPRCVCDGGLVLNPTNDFRFRCIAADTASLAPCERRLETSSFVFIRAGNRDAVTWRAVVDVPFGARRKFAPPWIADGTRPSPPLLDAAPRQRLNSGATLGSTNRYTVHWHYVLSSCMHAS
jgi:hypothetical protein